MHPKKGAPSCLRMACAASRSCPNRPGFASTIPTLPPVATWTRGTYTGQAGPVYIEPKNNPGAYDREVFLVLKEFGPSLSRGGDMAMDLLAGPIPRGVEAARSGRGRGSPMRKPRVSKSATSCSRSTGRMLGHGEPLRVEQGERVLFHVLNASAGEIRSLALPGHVFRVVALDGNPVPNPATVPVLWLGTAERISAIVEMNRPGVWSGRSRRRRPPAWHGHRRRIRRQERRAAMDQTEAVSAGTTREFGKAPSRAIGSATRRLR